MGFVCIEFTRVVGGIWFGDLKELSLLGSWIFKFYWCRKRFLRLWVGMLIVGRQGGLRVF